MANGQKDESQKRVAQDMLDFINASATQFHAVGKAMPSDRTSECL